LFPDTVIVVQRERIEAAFDGGISWAGAVVGEPHSSVVMVADAQDGITGYISMNQRVFEIGPIESGLHYVSEIDPRQLPPGAEPLPSFPKERITPARRGNINSIQLLRKTVTAVNRSKIVEKFEFSAQSNGKTTPSKGELVIIGARGAWQLSDLPTWITASKTNGVAKPRGLKVVFRPSADGLTTGIHTTRFRIKVSDGTNVVVRVRLTITDPPPPPPPPGTIIDVLFVFTPAAALSTTQPLPAKAQAAATLANQAFARGGLDLGLRVVGVETANGYDESVRTYREVLGDVTYARGVFSTTHEQRDALGADLVVAFTKRQEYCGIAYITLEPSAETEHLGFSVTTVNCVATFTVHHEIGHNMGLYHDRYVSDYAPNTVYNFGYTSPTGRWRTVMAYQNACWELDEYCPPINTFSSPLVFEDGVATGIPAGENGAADNVRRLGETKAAISQYRQTIVPNDASPAMLVKLHN